MSRNRLMIPVAQERRTGTPKLDNFTSQIPPSAGIKRSTSQVIPRKTQCKNKPVMKTRDVKRIKRSI
jgi:hypothetical protein